MVAFSHIKEKVSLLDAAERLGLKLTEQNGQWRGPCPVCNAGGSRALVITPSRGWYCWHAKRGGDVIGLVSHIKQLQVKEAAEWLAGVETKQTKEDGFPALDHLQASHEKVQLILSEESALSYGVGFTTKGFLKGTVGVPLYTPQGTRLGYLGIEDDGTYRIHKDIPHLAHIFNAHQVGDREVRLVGSVEDVLRAYDVGLDAICFLTPTISHDQLKVLAAWLEDTDRVLIF